MLSAVGLALKSARRIEVRDGLGRRCMTVDIDGSPNPDAHRDRSTPEKAALSSAFDRVVTGRMPPEDQIPLF